jgi:hypothetical protein
LHNFVKTLHNGYAVCVNREIEHNTLEWNSGIINVSWT